MPPHLFASGPTAAGRPRGTAGRTGSATGGTARRTVPASGPRLGPDATGALR
ncbi:hypothetical protein ACWDR1_17745 [Streptosporangium sandarakinum]|uniref:hypothetical protein n=1 Tax=Streptosporangium sandarakinum TaxID=1260955 RepID=UPI0033B0B66F